MIVSMFIYFFALPSTQWQTLLLPQLMRGLSRRFVRHALVESALRRIALRSVAALDRL
jgi:hypothetical protein